MIRCRALGEAFFIALACVGAAAAQEYSFRLYGPAEGLQNLVVLSLAEDHDGYIWAGTEGGLYRYDGTRFRLMGEAEGLPCSTEVHDLFVASDGAVWANTCNRIFRFDGQRFLSVPGVDSLLRGAQVMTDGTRGGVLVSTPAGLDDISRGSNGAFLMRSHPLPARLADKPTYGIVRQGPRVWFGCGLELCMEDAGQISVFGTEQGLPKETWDAIQIAPDGSVWVRSPKSLYRRPPGQTRFSQEEPDIASCGFWGALALGGSGSILVPTDHGLAIHTHTGWNLVNRRRGLRNETTAAALEDREGSVWIGLAGGGVARWLGRGVWESWKTNQELPGDIVWNIRRDRKGALWVGLSAGLARIEASGQIRVWTQKDGLGGDNVRWLAETSDGAIWAVSKPGGLARVDPVSGKIRQIGLKDGLACDPEDIFVDRRARLWLPTKCGLFLNPQPSASNRVVRVETPESFGREAWKIIEDGQGTIWVTNRTSLWSFRDGRWLEYRRGDGLLTDNPYVMALAPDGSIWMRHRYDAGIDRLDVSGDRIVRATPIVPADPKKAAGTAFHGFDAFGNFWLGTTNGVAVLHGGSWTRFTTEDGLVSNDCDGEAFWADTNGEIWLGTSGGLARYRYPTRVPPAEPVASPTITHLEINQSIRLVRAEFSSLNYKAEQLVRFAYRLDQSPWTDLTAREISISGLGPGSHRLEVRCRVRDGAFAPAIAAAEFQMEPRWIETWWARLLALSCLVWAIFQLFRWRLGAAGQKQAELEQIVAARTSNLSEANRQLDDKARQLYMSEERMKSAERLAHVGHWEWDLTSGQLSWSDEMSRILDIPQPYASTYDCLVQAVLPDDRERFDRWVKRCIEKKSGDSIEFHATRPNGDLRTLTCTSTVSLDPENKPVRFFGACQDITDARRAQQEDFARKKLESLGTLASGIAHDFNNLLGGVLAQAELGLAESASGSVPNGELTMIREVAIRGSEIVRQLMAYAGKESEAVELVDISRVVVEMLELIRISVSKHVTLITDLGEDLPLVRANASQIRQIVLNLVINASEAIGDRDGTIRVITARISAARVPLAIKDPAQDYVQLEVCDSGCGMSQETQAGAFEPFFTTKGPGHGLGLAVVHGIVRGMGGTIRISSAPGRGTTFRIFLPASDGAAASTRARTADAREPEMQPRQSVVLVVEDEDALRQPVVAMLRKIGFTVLEAANGWAAIDLLRASGRKIDLMLLDMTIPGPSSHEVFAAARQAGSNIRVILTSAYSPEMLKPPITAEQIQAFIRKPYQFRELMQTIRKASST